MMHYYYFLLSTGWVRRLAVGGLIWWATAFVPLQAAPQTDIDVSPDATPEIQQVSPNQAVAGAHVTVTFQGRNFSSGVYVSAVAAAIHVESSKRISATQMEAQLSVSATAPPMTVSLLVSNPASRAAEAAFKIVAGETPAAPAAPAAEIKPSSPPTPTAPAAPAAEVKPPSPTMPAAPVTPSAPPAPEVTTVQPTRVAPGYDIDLKITGKNFAQGVKVSFANPGIRVLGITAPSDTELTVHIKVARDATRGATSVYVINPDDQEVESPFEVVGKGPAAPPAPTPATPTEPAAPATAGAATQRYAVYSLSDPGEILHIRDKVKGALVVSSGKIRCEEGSKVLFDAALSDIKEIEMNTIGGFDTGTFHIILKSGKTYHFAPVSLHHSESRTIVDALHKVLFP
jgi:hypothetical protein